MFLLCSQLPPVPDLQVCLVKSPGTAKLEKSFPITVTITNNTCVQSMFRIFDLLMYSIDMLISSVPLFSVNVYVLPVMFWNVQLYYKKRDCSFIAHFS